MHIDRQLGLTENAMKVLERRYLIKDDEGKVVESPKDLFTRVARHIAKAEYKYGLDDADVKRTEERYYNAIANREFMPNSPTLMNAG
ncbi:MAG TPA: hypothetical protein ENO07_04370, partial [candidate division Zixibacteria bacterium]|nr:hypothetical protein [candidate division Zixibacteria bacterium]